MPEGEDFTVYLFSYRHEGAEWTFSIAARDPADAKARVAQLCFATYDGELIARVPAAAGWLARCVVAVREFFHTA